MYGSQVWGSTSQMNKKIASFTNKLVHIVVAPWYVRHKVLHEDLKIDPISEFIERTSTSFFNKIHQICNELLQRPASDPALPNSRKYPRTAVDDVAVFDNFPSIRR
ncbi:hypothetical protein AVEN_73222-1 [Araneus ventricosus]|uniref:Uncharacterized protein n=1 Tax=Araneus ventricosus TaxID=182803 RepID=A0A4Y2LWV0_ARAVE|nr:hypothetical protein AVEN_73222-1 [Araneus ventricosus]